MGISAFDPVDTSNYDFQYVPHRLAALELCVVSCYRILSGALLLEEQYKPKVDLATPFGHKPLCSIEQFVGISIDAGLVALRTLLNFLGIKLDNNTLNEKKYAHTVDEHGLSLISVATACAVLEPIVTSTDLKAMLIEGLQTASKSSAHFTADGATISVERLGYACYATSLLIRQHYFDAKGLPQPAKCIPMEAKPDYWSGLKDPDDRMC